MHRYICYLFSPVVLWHLLVVALVMITVLPVLSEVL